jgi:hypothetical protein
MTVAVGLKCVDGFVLAADRPLGIIDDRLSFATLGSELTAQAIDGLLHTSKEQLLKPKTSQEFTKSVREHVGLHVAALMQTYKIVTNSADPFSTSTLLVTHLSGSTKLFVCDLLFNPVDQSDLPVSVMGAPQQQPVVTSAINLIKLLRFPNRLPNRGEAILACCWAFNYSVATIGLSNSLSIADCPSTSEQSKINILSGDLLQEYFGQVQELFNLVGHSLNQKQFNSPDPIPRPKSAGGQIGFGAMPGGKS